MGRLGGREENHLANITATRVSGIWNQQLLIVRRKKEKNTEQATVLKIDLHITDVIYVLCKSYITS